MVNESVNVLTVNAGSSSVKLSLFSFAGDESTRIEEMTFNSLDRQITVSAVVEWVREIAADRLTAIGHRIVHGGPKYDRPEQLTEGIERELHLMSKFDPGHAQLALELITKLRQEYPSILQYACFDTAFFHDLPKNAQLIPIPREYRDQGIRRYGFHGLSYSYLQSAFRETAGETAVNGRVIYAHLGSGSSLAATLEGRPVDTTMSLTPASGVVMSSRSGDLDPGMAWYLHNQAGLSLEDYNHMVNFESGLLGISGLSADMYTLIQNESSNSDAAQAVELFCYKARQAIGGLATTIGGLDSLIFSGGIGEQSDIIRRRICAGLEFLGINLDEERNKRHEMLISASASKVGVHVINTDEAQIIAEQVWHNLREGTK